LYVFSPESESFIPFKEKFAGIRGLQFAVGSIFQGVPGYLVFNSTQNEGFYLLEWKTKKMEHVIIDSVRRSSAGNSIAADASGNLWGVTLDSTSGVWNYNIITKKILCSWKENSLDLQIKGLLGSEVLYIRQATTHFGYHMVRKATWRKCFYKQEKAFSILFLETCW
jgi:hypothetical protein